MAVAKVQVLVTLNGAGVWRIVSPIDPTHVRHLSEEELVMLGDAIPALIESVMNKKTETTASKKKPTKKK